MSPDGGPDIDEVARLAATCPSVVRLSVGAGVEVATYLPGRRVEGVRLVDDVVEVHVVARYGPSMSEVAGEVRGAVQPVVGAWPVAVVIEDVDLEFTPVAGP